MAWFEDDLLLLQSCGFPKSTLRDTTFVHLAIATTELRPTAPRRPTGNWQGNSNPKLRQQPEIVALGDVPRQGN